MLRKDDLPFVVAQVQKIACVGKVEELASRPFIRFAFPAWQEIVAVQMNLRIILAKHRALLHFFLQVLIPERRCNRREPIEMGNDVVRDAAGFDNPRPFDKQWYAETTLPVVILLVVPLFIFIPPYFLNPNI